MCKEDIREGRRKVTAVRQVSVPAASTPGLIAESMERTHIMIAAVGTGCRITPAPLDAATGGCFFVDSTKPAFEVDIETHGDVVTRGWNLAGNGGVSTIVIVETFWDDPDR